MGFRREDFVEAVDDNLICSICHEVLEDPRQCKEGHLFCSPCITTWLRRSRACPMDNSALTVGHLVPCVLAKNMVINLQVFCHPPDSDGEVVDAAEKCDWTGKLKSLDKHKEKCPFQQVKCPNVNCNANIKRRELEDHDKICEYKKVNCDEQCGVTLIRRDLPNHKRNVCPEVTLPCPNRCEASIKRKNITKHRETCLFQHVQCPNVNCKTNMRRRELEDHDKICEYKKVNCDEQCGVTLIRRDLPNHKRNVCPEATLPCPNRCEASIKRKNIIKHRETCPFQEVQCPNVNCNTNMQRRELENHDKICKYKNVQCEKCMKRLLRYDLQHHKDVDCAEEMVPCPNRCRSSESGQINKIKRSDLEWHPRNECAKTILDCPFKDQGCLLQFERQYFGKHVQHNMAAHLMLLAKENKYLKEELNQVKEDLERQLSSTNTYTWKICDFPGLVKRHPNGSAFTSPCFWLLGYRFSIKVYPNGINKLSEGFLSVYLHLREKYTDLFLKVNSKVSNSEVNVQYRFSLIRQPRGADVGPHVSTRFISLANSSDTHEVDKFIKTNEALSAAYCNSTNGSLTIQCTIQLDKPQ